MMTLLIAVFSAAYVLAGSAVIPKGSIGAYSNGCLNDDVRLPSQVPGLHQLFIERDRNYGNPVMLDLLTSLGLATAQAFAPSYEPNQLGDISQRHGGEISRHVSHQVGLDVDVVYFRNDHRVTKADRGAQASFDEDFVKGGKVTANFDGAREWWRFEWLNKNARLDRIFVDPAIKNYLCAHAELYQPVDAKLRAEVLRRLRPYEAHEDHFHLRLECPLADVRCVASQPVPPGDGCNETSDERDARPSRNDGPLVLGEKPAPSKHRPPECASLAKP